MKKKIIRILNEILKAEDKDKIIFPLLYKLALIQNRDLEKLRELIINDEDINKILKSDKGEFSLQEFIENKLIFNNETRKEWEDYIKRRSKEK